MKNSYYALQGHPIFFLWGVIRFRGEGGKMVREAHRKCFPPPKKKIAWGGGGNYPLWNLLAGINFVYPPHYDALLRYLKQKKLTFYYLFLNALHATIPFNFFTLPLNTTAWTWASWLQILMFGVYLLAILTISGLNPPDPRTNLKQIMNI